ncbi:NAD(P)-dependent oxidoreductase [Massilia suwonensis]|uniref:NAD(P)-dependent oxidoreductase n=1 Tax=Massilia suwonensis TaxID=648895 RepID=A0ABW0MLW4_9BURK
MNIALIGASGYVGAALLKEASARGHDITALASRPERIATAPNIHARQVEVLDREQLAAALRGHDAVISAFSGHAQAEVRAYYVEGMESIIAATRQADVPRLLVVGGAGGLEVAPGVQLLDTPAFPAEWKETAEGARQAVNRLREETELDWTVLAPSAHLEPGERTGSFRLGKDALLIDAAGNSHISLEDYAVAMIDELERPAHSRTRFTVGY